MPHFSLHLSRPKGPFGVHVYRNSVQHPPHPLPLFPFIRHQCHSAYPNSSLVSNPHHLLISRVVSHICVVSTQSSFCSSVLIAQSSDRYAETSPHPPLPPPASSRHQPNVFPSPNPLFPPPHLLPPSHRFPPKYRQNCWTPSKSCLECKIAMPCKIVLSN